MDQETIDNSLSIRSLVSDIVNQLDYDLWKEMFIHAEEDDDYMINIVEDLIIEWCIRNGYMS